MKITLTVTAGPHQGKKFTFEGHDTFIVGRAERAHFRLPTKDRFFSRVHFLVEVNPPQCRLMDLGSRNGTTVNGQKVTRADLKDGDEIKAGHTFLRLAVEKPEAVDVPDNMPTSLDSGKEAAVAEPLRAEMPLKAAGAGPAAIAAEPPKTVIPLEDSDERPAAVAAEPPKTVIPLEDSGERPAAVAAKPPKAVVPAKDRPGKVSAPRQPAPKPGPALCRVCGNSVQAAERGLSAEPTQEVAVPLCRTCAEAIGKQPQPIAGYRIVRELGRGGMGVVYLALRGNDGKLVALKTIIPAVAGSKVQVERFLRESKILRELNHPHIVACDDIGESQGQLFFAMDFVKGVDAAHVLESQGPLPIRRAAGFTCQLLEALEYAHAKQFVHRDIKPANMLVTTGPSAGSTSPEEIVKLADFGLARVYQASQLSGLTMTGAVGGTLAFMAPEQILQFRDVKPAADQYSVGATLYNLLTDRTVYDFPRQTEQALLMILQDDPIPIQSRRRDVPKELAAVVHRALARDPAERFEDVKKMRKALAKFAD